VKERRARKDKNAFTLVEVTAASVLLCLAVMLVVGISTRALTETKLNRQKELAAALIEKQLSLIDYVGIEEFIERGHMEGVFDEYDPVYRWEVATEAIELDNLYLVKVTVGWFEFNKPYSLSALTRLNGKGMIIDVEEE
jgi:hypothetical protein